MARRAQPVALGLAAAAVSGGIALIILGTLAAVLGRAEAPGGLARADWAAVRFTLLQASLSALLSCALAVPVARALSRRRFPGRGLMITALGAPFLLPVIVAVFGLLAVFGRSGLMNLVLGWLGLPRIEIYGLGGVLLAHVFFNLPLATRLLLQGWQAIPAETFRLAAALSMPDRAVFRAIEMPMLRSALPGALTAVFLLCLTSFAVVLALGGGPRATTIELAIYQAFSFDFDLSRAALLALVQIGLGLSAGVLALWVGRQEAAQGLDLVVTRWDGRGWRRWLDVLGLGVVVLFVGLPLGVVVLRGIEGLALLPSGLLGPTLRSLFVALAATALTGIMALPLALYIGGARGSRPARLAEVVGALSIAASPLVLGTGLFIVLNPFVDPVSVALPVTALVNALMALPFALRALIPAAAETHRRFDRLSASLGMGLFARLRLVILPRLRGALGFALGLAAALSAGDLGVVILFTNPAQATLPMEMYGLMDAYRTREAAAAALILTGLAFGLFWVFDRLVGRDG